MIKLTKQTKTKNESDYMIKTAVFSLIFAAIVSACAMNAPKKQDVDVDVEMITFDVPIVITAGKN